MCGFFSFISDGEGKMYYFDAKIRRQILKGKSIGYALDSYTLDSHTSIADYFGFKGRGEDRINKYEYNPLTKIFQINQLNTTDDSDQIKRLCEQLDFKTIVPQLVIKPIVYPFQIQKNSVTKEDIELLKKWVSSQDSTWDSIWYSIEDVVGKSVWKSVATWVRISLWDSFGDSVEDENPIWHSVWDLIKDSIGDYTLSFFEFQGKKNPCQSCADLWERGLLTSCNGEMWRLHGGKRGEILWKS